MARAFKPECTPKFQPGDEVRHPSWPEGLTAKVVDTYPQQVRAVKRKSELTQAHFANVCKIDKAIALCGGSIETDDHWMESGLEYAGKNAA